MPFNSASKGTAGVGEGHRVLGRISARERDSPAVLDETRRRARRRNTFRRPSLIW